jgi:hypothetical protein
MLVLEGLAPSSQTIGSLLRTLWQAKLFRKNGPQNRVTRLSEILPFGRFFMAKFFLEKIAQ